MYGGGKSKKIKNKKQSEGNITKDVNNLFRLKKEMKQRQKTIRDIKNLLKQEKDYYKLVRVGNNFINTYIEYQINGDINKTPLIKEYLDKIKPYLKNIINYFRKFHSKKIQLIISNNFISSKDTDKERVMHSMSVYDNHRNHPL